MDAEKNKTKVKGKSLYLNSEDDLVSIRKYGRLLAKRVGFDENDCTLIATAISEICHNVLEHAAHGMVKIESNYAQRQIIITISDNGPGIEDIDLALQEGFSTEEGLGIGLPGAKRIMDTFEIYSRRGEGTTVIMSKLLDNKNLLF